MDVRVRRQLLPQRRHLAGRRVEDDDEVGIKNVNIDNFTDGLSRIEIGGFSSPMLGFSTSLPWDRGETTTNITGIVTKLFGNHTLKVGGECRHNRDFLLQIQDTGGVRGRFGFGGRDGRGHPGGQAATSNSASPTPLRPSCSTCPTTIARHQTH